MRAVKVRSFTRLVLAATFFAATFQAWANPQELLSNDPSPEIISRSWSTDDGLPHNVVTRIQQDEAGYLWLATLSGLTRFDGREFKVFGPALLGENSGRNIRDFALCADASIFFLPATGGVLVLKDEKITVHPISAQLKGKALTEIYVEPGGAVWVGTETGLARWENGRLEFFGNAEGINRRFLRFSFATDGKGRTWIAGADFFGYYRDGKLIKEHETAGIVFRVAPARSGGIWIFGDALSKWEQGRLTRLADEPWSFGHSSVRTLFEDKDGVLWVGTSRDGAYRFEGNRFARVPGIETAIESITDDREGSIWIATYGGGIRRLRPNPFTIFDSHAGLTKDVATSVCEDKVGNFWFAKNALGVVRKARDTLQTFPFSGHRAALYVNSVQVDPSGELWMSTPTGVYRASPDDYALARRAEPFLRSPRLLFCTSAGDVWVAGSGTLGYFHGGVFNSLADARGQLNETADITAIAEAPIGHLWLGTALGGLYEFTGQTFVRSPAQPDAASSIGNISAFSYEPSGELWIAGVGGLLLKKGDHFRRFTQADGLPENVILQFLADDHGNFWLGTPRGLCRVERAELLQLAEGRITRVNAVTYGPDEGLSGISPAANYQPSAWKDAHGMLWFCTYKGVVEVDPARVQRNAPPPPVLIKEVKLDGNPTDPRKDLLVSPGEHRVEFSFAALSFVAPGRVQLRHLLEGFDLDWVETAPDRIARYAKLPPGSYRLRVIACNSEGIWNREGAVLAVTVLPAWWQTNWFRGAAFLVFTGVISFAAKFWSQRKLKRQVDHLERERALEKERTRIARDLHDDLGGSVTGINLLVQQLRDRAVEKDLAGIAENLDARVQRLTVELERVVWTVSPKNSSLDQLANFVERFAHNLFESSAISCRVRGRENIPARPLMPECQHHILAVTKEAINNVLKHSHAAEAVISMSFHDNMFSLSVSDDGIGFTPDAKEHSERNGLRNMRARMGEIGGSLDIHRTTPRGAEVILCVPIKTPAKG